MIAGSHHMGLMGQNPMFTTCEPSRHLTTQEVRMITELAVPRFKILCIDKIVSYPLNIGLIRHTLNDGLM